MVQVNEVVVGDISHDEALALLAGAGDTVTLLLKHYKAATPFLLKQFGRCISPSSQSPCTIAHFIIIYRRYIPEFEPQGSEEVPNSCSDDDGPFPHSQTSQLVPDSPCSVSSDCSGSWIGIPRSDYRLLSVISSVLCCCQH